MIAQYINRDRKCRKTLISGLTMVEAVINLLQNHRIPKIAIDPIKIEMADMRAELDGRLKALEALLNITTLNK